MSVKKWFFIIYVSTSLLLASELRAQNQDISITEYSAAKLGQDSFIYSVTYNLSLQEEQDFARISIQRKAMGADFYSDISNRAAGDIGEITAGTNYTITFKEPDIQIPFEVKICANQDPEVDVMGELVNQIDSVQLRANLELIQGIRHRTDGAEQLLATQNLIRARFSEYGIQIREDTFSYGPTYDGINFIGSQLGCGQNDKAWLIGGHYDTVDESPGADDNGSAIAGMLEAARVLSQYQFEKRISYVAWDLEEEGLVGSTNFVTNLDSTFADIEGYLNFEMIGYYSDKPNTQSLPAGFDQLFSAQEQTIADDQFRGNFISNVGNTQNSTEIMNAFEAAATVYVPNLKVISLAAPGTGAIVPDLRRSDHTPFWLADIPALMITDGANFRNPNYHSERDILDSLNFTFMSQVVQASVATVAQAANPTICFADEIEITMFPGVSQKNVVLNSFSLFPNPAKNLITVQFADANMAIKKDYIIHDIYGKEIQTGALNADYSVNTSQLDSGLYFISFKIGNTAHLAKFIIQK